MVGIPTQEKDPRHPQVCGKGTDLEGGAGAAAAGVPRSLPPRPVPGSEAQHWYKGWETGPWEESSVCSGAAHCLTVAFCLLPASEGGGSCQRKWAYIKASRKGQGRVRGATAQAGILSATPEGRDCRGQGP